MIELTLSLLAWIGVVLFQAVVHYLLTRSRRTLKDEELEENLLQLENADNRRTILTVEHGYDDAAALVASSSCGVLVGDEEQGLDGDEPDVFFELLSQTGSEMVHGCNLETRVQQELQVSSPDYAGEDAFRRDE